MTTAYLLQHVRTIDGQDDVKVIGVYSSKTLARDAITRLSTAQGFRDGGEFSIDPYELDEDHWKEGYVTLVTLHVPLLDEGTDVWRPIQAELLSENRYRVLGPMPEDEAWEFPPDSIVSAVERELSSGPCLVAEKPRSGAA